MSLNSYELIKKDKLTSDIYELTFQVKDKFDFKPGQFVTFILPNI
jgi:NAD(P)H-flavin reductase